ncbi:MAG: hypothetical protein QXY40_08120 [Candidatus Methanomethylicia archaeon]
MTDSIREITTVRYEGLPLTFQVFIQIACIIVYLMNSIIAVMWEIFKYYSLRVVSLNHSLSLNMSWQFTYLSKPAQKI